MDKDKARQSSAMFSFTYLGLCILLSVGGAISPAWFELFRAHLNPEYPWQYVSYAFMHGTPGEPAFIMIHLLLNTAIILKVGRLSEQLIGAGHMVLLSLLACVGFFFTQQATGLPINGASGVIWAYSAVLFAVVLKNRKQPADPKLKNLQDEARLWLAIMWGVVTVFMGLVPYLFGSKEPIWSAFFYGNIFHAQAVIIGLLYMWAVHPLPNR